MATLHKNSAADYAGVKFGIPAEEESTVGSLITNKVSITTKVKKKDLRGRKGGFKSVVSFGKSIEYSIDAAIAKAGSLGFVLAATHTPKNDPFVVAPTVMFVESITINEKNDDFQRVSVKLVGSPDLGAPSSGTV